MKRKRARDIVRREKSIAPVCEANSDGMLLEPIRGAPLIKPEPNEVRLGFKSKLLKLSKSLAD